MSSEANEKLILALPKGRILKEAAPLFARAGIEPEPAFADPEARQLRFTTNHPDLDIIRVRSLRRRDLRGLRRRPARHRRRRRADGVRLSRDLRADRSRHRPLPAGRRRAGRDGGQRRSAALEPRAHRHQVSRGDAPPLRRARRAGRVREALRRDGAGAVARPQPSHRRSGRPGRTLKDNGLVEIEHIADITSRFIVNRAALKTQPERIGRWVDRFREIVPCRLEARRRGAGLRKGLFGLPRRAIATPTRTSIASWPTSSPTCAPAATRRSSNTREKFDRLDTDALGPAHLRCRASTPRRPRCRRRSARRSAFAARRIEAFHRALLPKDVDFTDATGTRLGARYRPLDSVGVYVPGGTAAYPSSVLMNIVPAKVAGVRRIVMVVPTPGGVLNPLVMLAAEIAGADEVWRIGGAQAVAALAYGTQSIAAGRQDHRPRQRLCRGRQAPRVRPGRHRPDRRPVGDPGRRRRRRTIPPGSPPTFCRRPSTMPPRSRS